MLGIAATLMLLILTVLLLTPEFSQTKADQTAGDLFPQQYKIITPKVADYLVFAGETIPLKNYEVRERVEREFIINTYFHSATLLAIKRANRWFPVIEPILKQNNVPDDFKYLCVAESNLENASSPAGAKGFWQFVQSAAEKYNLEINNQVDERYHVVKSTQAACDYLNEAYKRFGTWTMAAASYNMGISGIDKQIERQKSNNYYNLMLGVETSRYIPRIIAIKYIMQDWESYGFQINADELYKPLSYYEVTLDSTVNDFTGYAANFGMNYKTLKMYNPWLRDNFLSNKTRHIYKINIPEPGSIELIE
jgi:hypothetical protein